MKITKYVHACLLVETPERVGIIDPGEYSWDSGLLDIARLERLDDILITHDHSDHMSIPFIQSLVAKFPHVKIVTTVSAAKTLRDVGITAATVGNEAVELFTADHESMEPLMSSMTANTGVHYLGQLTHPGDSYTVTGAKSIVALPVIAPWGSMREASQLGTDLKPQYIIPIHDSQYSDTARTGMYGWLEGYFKSIGVTFIQAENGVPFEV